MKTNITQKQVDEKFKQDILSRLNDTPEKDKKEAREEFQKNVISSFLEIA